tara:strand:- start:34834 stop:35541 length:708 start_codon:yes stop_codon:yes gene_type:complete
MADREKYLEYLKTNRANLLDESESLNFANREIETIFFLLKNFYNFHNNSKKDLNILDLGCGDKFIQKPIEKLNYTYKGLDIDDLDLEKDHIKLPDNSIDIVVSLGLIEALNNPSHLIKESYRVLKKDGYIYLITPNWKMDYKNFYNNFYHKTPFTPESLETALKLTKFNEIKTFPGLRCKPKWYYEGKFRFEKAYYLLPFSNNHFLNYSSKKIKRNWVPEFLKGHARSIIAIAKK